MRADRNKIFLRILAIKYSICLKIEYDVHFSEALERGLKNRDKNKKPASKGYCILYIVPIQEREILKENSKFP